MLRNFQTISTTDGNFRMILQKPEVRLEFSILPVFHIFQQLYINKRHCELIRNTQMNKFASLLFVTDDWARLRLSNDFFCQKYELKRRLQPSIYLESLTVQFIHFLRSFRSNNEKKLISLHLSFNYLSVVKISPFYRLFLTRK